MYFLGTMLYIYRGKQEFLIILTPFSHHTTIRIFLQFKKETRARDQIKPPI